MIKGLGLMILGNTAQESYILCKLIHWTLSHSINVGDLHKFTELSIRPPELEKSFDIFGQRGVGSRGAIDIPHYRGIASEELFIQHVLGEGGKAGILTRIGSWSQR